MMMAMRKAMNTSADAASCAPASSCMSENRIMHRLDTAALLAVSVFVWLILAVALPLPAILLVGCFLMIKILNRTGSESKGLVTGESAKPCMLQGGA